MGRRRITSPEDICNVPRRCHRKQKLAVVEKAVEAVQREFLNESEQFEEHMKAKSIIHQEIEEQGSISIPEVTAKVFGNQEAMQENSVRRLRNIISRKKK